jgi:hypothetical protein
LSFSLSDLLYSAQHWQHQLHVAGTLKRNGASYPLQSQHGRVF